ncbi:radical SAM protein with 4Fe4S-binding SPASM domain [Dysgonomonas alginatilytica]|uniref:Radical SAM protein with 4Fe4S-binding SPASM domain n=1 Tax=Dysgonomonas alginatilytica TaxID=1605892 RepID=A0A2V3PKM9_9BACT|nr:SPASM domain-containing protein [Dysgonomonas alginatilytica]PXV62201.1 radical SAM protein with 4Fe4S-binding SPASM domain [Dysgonomonas alginatilytica]
MFKESFYNFYIPKNDSILYFNGITCSNFIVTKSEHQKLQELFEDAIDFEINYPSIFNQFVKWGFLFDDSTDEIDTIRFRHRMATIDSKDYSLVINAALKEDNTDQKKCNCHNNPVGHMSDETVNKVINHILYMVNKKRITSLLIIWAGSDPLEHLEKVIYPISQFAQSICNKNSIKFKNHINTSLSDINISIIPKLIEIELNNIQISYNNTNTTHDDIALQKEIKNKIPTLYETLDDPTINLDIKGAISDNTKALIDGIQQKYTNRLVINYGKSAQVIQNIESKKRQQKKLRTQCRPKDIFSVKPHYKCNSDRMYHASINFDGKVYSCINRDYSDMYVFGEVNEHGEIKYNNEKLKQKLSKPPFENPMCLACKYLPMCLGPCSQKIMETHKDALESACILNYVDIDPEAFILNLYEEKLKQNNNV